MLGMAESDDVLGSTVGEYVGLVEGESVEGNAVGVTVGVEGAMEGVYVFKMIRLLDIGGTLHSISVVELEITSHCPILAMVTLAFKLNPRPSMRKTCPPAKLP